MGILTAIPRTADKGYSGLSYVLLANWSEVTTTVDGSTGYATFKGADGSTALANTVFKRFDMTKETSNWTETGTGSANAGTTTYNQVLTLVFARNEALKRNTIKIMGKSELVAVAVDRNGYSVVLGSENGLDMTSGVTGSGTAGADMAGSTITLTANEVYPHGIVLAATLDALTP